MGNRKKSGYIRLDKNHTKRRHQTTRQARLVVQMLEPRKLLCGGGFHDGDISAFQTQLTTGLDTFRSFGDQVDSFGDLAIEFSTLDSNDPNQPATLGESLDLGDIVNQVFVQTVSDFYNGGGTQASELVAALSNVTIPDLNLSIDCIEGGFTDGESELRFDIQFQVNRNTDFSYSVDALSGFLNNSDIQGFTGDLQITGSDSVTATMSADASINLSFGLDLHSQNDDFFLREIDPAQIGAQLQIDLPTLTLSIGSDQFANISGSSLTINAGGALSLIDPDGDGFIKVNEIDLSQFTLNDLTKIDSIGTFDALLPIGVTPPGLEGFNLGNGVVTARVDNFFRDGSPTVSVDVDINEGFLDEVVLSGLGELQNVTSAFTSQQQGQTGLLDETIPFINKSINDFFNIDTLFTLQNAADSYIQGATTPTLHGLATSLLEHLNDANIWDQTAGDATLDNGPVRIRAGVSAESKQAFFELDLNLQRDFRLDYLDQFSAQDLNVLLSGLSLDGFDNLIKLEVSATDDASLVLSATLNANIAFGIDLDGVLNGGDAGARAQAFYLSFDPNRPWFTVQSVVNATLPGFTIQIGDGTNDLFSGSISGGTINIDTTGAINFNDLNEDGRLTFAEMNSADTGNFETNLVSFTPRGTLDTSFNLGASFAGFENLGQTVVQAHVDNIFKTPPGEFTFGDYLNQLDKNVTADFDLSGGGLNAAIEAGLGELQSFFDGSDGSITSSDTWTTKLPIIEQSLADMLNLSVLSDLSNEAKAYLEDPVFTRDLNDALFPTLRGLSERLTERIQNELADSSGSLENRNGPIRIHAGFSGENNELFFDLKFEPTNVFQYQFDLTQLTDLLNGEGVASFGGSAISLGGITIGEAVDVRVDTELALALSFGIDLQNLIHDGNAVTSDDFYLIAGDDAPPLVEARALTTIGLPDLTISFGSYTDLSVVNNVIALDATGTISLNEPSGDGRLSFSEISLINGNAQVKASDFFTASGQGTLFGSFLFDSSVQLAEFGSFNTPALVNYRAEDLFILDPLTNNPYTNFTEYLAALDKSVAIDFDISGNVVDILKLGITELNGLFGTGIGDLGIFGSDFFNVNLPALNQSLGQLLGLDIDGSVWRNLGTQLANRIDAYINLPEFSVDLTDGLFPTLRGLGDDLVKFFDGFGIPDGAIDFSFGPLDLNFGFEAITKALDFNLGIDLQHFIDTSFSLQSIQDLLSGVNVDGFPGFFDLPGLDPNVALDFSLLG